jgi:hypothetical protein
MGRKKLWDSQLRLPVTEQMVSRIDAALATDEARVDFIRESIERELARRERWTSVRSTTRRAAK